MTVLERNWRITDTATGKLVDWTADPSYAEGAEDDGHYHVDEFVPVSSLEGAVEALRAMTPENPWYEGQDCRWCGVHYDHDPDCPWVAARAIVGGQ